MEKEYLTILLEEMDSKFGLVLEGHEALRSEIRGARDESNAKHEHTAFLINVLNDKIDAVADDLKATGTRLNDKIDGVEKKLSDKIDGVEQKLSDRIDGVEKNLSDKIDGVAADLKAHRADTEAHGDAGLYVIKEG